LTENVESRVALVTGANKGIGLETVRGLGKKGVMVMLASRTLANGESAAAKLRSEGIGSVRPMAFDVTRAEDHQKLASFLESNFGKLDILVNNAGVELEGTDFGATEGFNTTSTVALDVLRQTFETNFFSTVALTQALLPLIRRSPAGRIVNVTSILGSLTLHSDQDSAIYKKKAFAYDASKTAINAFTVHLAQELRETRIKVNSAHPGWVRTEMGGSAAPLDISQGGLTSVELATLPDDGPTGGYFHLGKPLPW
jgi:NAD(P)-dependent dehydrogenase (short-subunit alcohol dehydrogenase family)